MDEDYNFIINIDCSSHFLSCRICSTLKNTKWNSIKSICLFLEKYEAWRKSNVLSKKRSHKIKLKCLKHLIPKPTFYTVNGTAVAVFCLYGSRCSKSFLGSHFCMHMYVHSYYIFFLFFFSTSCSNYLSQHIYYQNI